MSAAGPETNMPPAAGSAATELAAGLGGAEPWPPMAGGVIVPTLTGVAIV